MAFHNIRLEFEGPIATLTFDRPAVLNALDSATLGEVEAALDEVAGRDDCRVLIVTGAGEKAFIAGADIAEMAALDPVGALAFAERGHRVCRRLETLPQPVIGAVNGFALGGGTEVALACDLLVASERAVFGQPEVKLGVVPGFGGTARLARRVGRAVAMEWILAGNNQTAAEALRVGLVNRVVAPEQLMQAARDLAATIAARGPLAVRAAKRLVHDGLSVPLDAALRTESVVFANLFATADQREGMAAFTGKRKADFQGR